MTYKFPLEAVLRLRESIEKREELVLQKAQYEVARAQQRINDLTEELAKAEKKREEALIHSVEAYRLQEIQAELRSAQEAKRSLFDALEFLKHQRDQQMRLYQAAHSGFRMLTNLRDQRRNDWEQEQERVQQRRLDDIYAARLRRG